MRAPDAVDRGEAARWWLNPSPSQCAALPARPVVVTLWSRAALTRHLAGRALHVWQRPLVAALPAVWPLLPAAVCCLTNSQGRDPRTPEVLRWAAPCPDAAPNSQMGTQDPKRPVCPPFSGTLFLLSPRAMFPCFVSGRLRHVRRTRGSGTRPKQGPCAVACVCW